MPNTSITHFFSPAFLSSDQRSNLSEEYQLCENGSMVFHWADFHETCDDVRARMAQDRALREDYERRESALRQLELIPVWIRTRSSVHQTTMFELYHKHVLNTAELPGVDLFGPLDLSFISASGPFKTMAASECFNRATYRDFVLVSLIQGKLPRRDFRIRLKAKILMQWVSREGAEASTLVQLEQMTTRGLLLSMDAQAYTTAVSGAGSIQLLLDSRPLGEALGKSLPELRAQLANHVFNLLYSSRKQDAVSCPVEHITAQSSFDFLASRKIYLFIGYQHLNAPGDEVRRISEFVAHTRELVRQQFSNHGKQSA
jgi:hypothetical protein